MRFTKRLAALLLTAVMLLTAVPAQLFVPLTAYAAESTTLTVTGDRVNVRSGAGTAYSKVTTVSRSTVLTSLGTAKDASGTTWYKVKVNGSTGYIVSTYVSASTTSSVSQKLTVTGTNVYVRKGAGTSYGYITTVKKGSSYKVLGSAKDKNGKTWYKISINNTTGYIISTYVKLNETGSTTSTTASSTSTTTAAPKRKLTVTGDLVNVRKGAGTNNSKVTAVKRGASFDILGTAKDKDSKTWYKIKVNGVTGYIISSYVKVTEVTTTKSTTTTTAETTTATSGIEITVGSGNSSASTTSTTTATTTTTTKTTKATVNMATTLAANVTVTLSYGDVELRSGAGESYSLMSTLNKGTTVVILSNRTDSSGQLWYRVLYASISGYIKAADMGGLFAVKKQTMLELF